MWESPGFLQCVSISHTYFAKFLKTTLPHIKKPRNISILKKFGQGLWLVTLMSKRRFPCRALSDNFTNMTPLRLIQFTLQFSVGGCKIPGGCQDRHSTKLYRISAHGGSSGIKGSNENCNCGDFKEIHVGAMFGRKRQFHEAIQIWFGEDLQTTPAVVLCSVVDKKIHIARVVERSFKGPKANNGRC